MNQPPEIRYATSGQLSIAYQLFGQGDGAVVVVPGVLSHIETTWSIPAFARFYWRLARFTRVALFDKRGTGQSDRFSAGAPPTLEERAEDVLAVMDAIGLSRASLIGTADGGPVAALFAATFPQRVRSLVLYASWARLARAPDYPLGFTEAELETSLRIVRERWGSDTVPLMAQRLAPSLGDDPQWRRTVARMQRLAATPATAVALFRSMNEMDIRAALPGITAPVLLLHVTGDRLVPSAHAHYLAGMIPHAKLLEIKGTDHLFFFENSDVVAQALEEFLTGRTGAESAEREMASILFTDVVGSTRTAVTLGDRRWTDLLEELEATVRREILLHGGRVVDTAGDGVFAVFGGPGRAIRCAVALRELLHGQHLEIRAGIHSGEVESRGDRVRGVAVHLGARIVAMADPGEILVSRTVRDLVAGSGVAFRDRGTHELKGLSEPWQLFAVASADA